MIKNRSEDTVLTIISLGAIIGCAIACTSTLNLIYNKVAEALPYIVEISKSLEEISGH